MTNFKWDDLRYFLAVYREGSFTKAARSLCTNQSTVSRRVAGLEDAMETRLFDRTPDGPVATDAAHLLAEHAQTVEDAVHAVSRDLAGHDAGMAGTVRIACVEGFATNYLAPALAPFHRDHPNIRVEITTGHSLVNLNRSEADIALRLVRPERGDLVAKKVASSAYGIYASTAYLKGRQGLSLRELDWLVWDHSMAHLPEMRWFERTVGVTPRLRTDSAQALYTACACGVGVAIAPSAWAAWMPLVEVPQELPLPLSVDVWLVTHRALRNVPRVSVVWEWMDALMAELRRGPSADNIYLPHPIWSGRFLRELADSINA